MTDTKLIAPKSSSLANFMLDFDGFEIRQRNDGYVHASDMCKVGGKRWNDYVSRKINKEFIKELKSDTNIQVSLIQSKRGGRKGEQGTWIHPRIAIHLAQWISAKFAVKVSEWVQKFIEGDLSLVHDALKQREKINDTTIGISIAEVNNKGKSDRQKQEELIQLHKTNVKHLEEKMREKDTVIATQNGVIYDLRRELAEFRAEMKAMMIDHGGKLEVNNKALNDTRVELSYTNKALNNTCDKLITSNNKLDYTSKELKANNDKLDTTNRHLSNAISQVVERAPDDETNYLCVLKLTEPKVINGQSYEYYTARCMGMKSLNRRKSKIAHTIVVCTLSSNYAMSSWKLISTKLKSSGKIKKHNNYFTLCEGTEMMSIYEGEIGTIFENMMNSNRGRVKDN
jgi:hypothetical protein